MAMDERRAAEAVAALEAQRQVANLVHRYALHIRNGEPAACASLLANDVTFTIRERDPRTPADQTTIRTSLSGREDVLAYICRSAGGEVRVLPIIHNLLIDVTGERATGNCLMVSRTWPVGHEFIGEYDDAFVRVDGGWLFAARTFTMFRQAGQ